MCVLQLLNVLFRVATSFLLFLCKSQREEKINENVVHLRSVHESGSNIHGFSDHEREWTWLKLSSRSFHVHFTFTTLCRCQLYKLSWVFLKTFQVLLWLTFSYVYFMAVVLKITSKMVFCLSSIIGDLTNLLVVIYLWLWQLVKYFDFIE